MKVSVNILCVWLDSNHVMSCCLQEILKKLYVLGVAFASLFTEGKKNGMTFIFYRIQKELAPLEITFEDFIVKLFIMYKN